MKKISEKRLYERFNISCTGLIEKDGEEIAIQITNMSGQGLGFRTSKLLEEHERLSIRLEVKDVQEPVIVAGEVAWSKGIDPDTYGVGFKLDMTSWIKISKILDP